MGVRACEHMPTSWGSRFACLHAPALARMGGGGRDGGRMDRFKFDLLRFHGFPDMFSPHHVGLFR